MAATLFHVQFGIISRSAGHSAVKRSAYQACARREDGRGRVYDWRKKRGEWAGGFMLAPDGAPAWATDPTRLWCEAEAAERRCDAQLARTIEISIPRAVPPHLREDFARFVLAPLQAQGMAIQVDLHCPSASDGAEQPHVHALLTLRAFEGEGFGKKNRDWNAAFTRDGGRAMRGLLAGRMNAFFHRDGIMSTVDHRRAPGGPGHAPPEKNVPRRAWAAWKADPTSSAAAPVRAVQDVRRLRHQHRAALAVHEAAGAEVAALSREARRRTPGIAPGDRAAREERRRRVLAGLIRQHYDTTWLPESVAANVHSVHLHPEHHRAVITLHDGARFVDHGDRITFHGPISRTAAAEIVAAAIRHGWKSVTLTGSLAFRDPVALECALREPPINTDHILSDEARQRLESQLKEREREKMESVQERTGRAIHAEIMRLEAILLACPPHLARVTIKSLARARSAQLLLSQGDSRIGNLAVGGKVVVALRLVQECSDALLPRQRGAGALRNEDVGLSKLSLQSKPE